MLKPAAPKGEMHCKSPSMSFKVMRAEEDGLCGAGRAELH